MIRWRTDRKISSASYSVPSVRKNEAGQEELLCCTQGEGIFALDPATGNENWSSQVFTMRTVSSPLFVGGLIFGSTGQGAGGHYVVALKPGNEPIVNGLIRQFPNLSVIDLSAIMNQVRTITNQVADAVSFVFLFTLAAGLVVLYAAIATTQDDRVFDAAIMRTLGASRRQMMIVQLAEFLAIGLLSGLIASGGAIALSTLLAEKVLSIPYSVNYWIPVIGILGGGLGISAAGLLGTRKAVTTPPLVTIRELE